MILVLILLKRLNDRRTVDVTW